MTLEILALAILTSTQILDRSDGEFVLRTHATCDGLTVAQSHDTQGETRRLVTRALAYLPRDVFSLLPHPSELVDATISHERQMQISVENQPSFSTPERTSLNFRFVGDFDRCSFTLKSALCSVGYTATSETTADGFVCLSFRRGHSIIRCTNNTVIFGIARSFDSSEKWHPYLTDKEFINSTRGMVRKLLDIRQSSPHEADEPVFGQHGLVFLVEAYMQ
jgi:hypothetical protein